MLISAHTDYAIMNVLIVNFYTFFPKYQNLYILVNCALPTNDLRRLCAHNDANMAQNTFQNSSLNIAFRALYKLHLKISVII